MKQCTRILIRKSDTKRWPNKRYFQLGQEIQSLMKAYQEYLNPISSGSELSLRVYHEFLLLKSWAQFTKTYPKLFTFLLIQLEFIRQCFRGQIINGVLNWGTLEQVIIISLIITTSQGNLHDYKLTIEVDRLFPHYGHKRLVRSPQSSSRGLNFHENLAWDIQPTVTGF